MSKNIDYELIRGDTKTLKKFRPVDQEGNEITLNSNDEIYFTIKNASKKKVLQKTINNGIEKLEDGYYRIILEAEDTEELKAGTYTYDIEVDLNLESERLFVNTIIEGEIVLNQDITTKGDK